MRYYRGIRFGIEEQNLDKAYNAAKEAAESCRVALSTSKETAVQATMYLKNGGASSKAEKARELSDQIMRQYQTLLKKSELIISLLYAAKQGK